MMIDCRFYEEEDLGGGRVRLSRGGHSAVYPRDGVEEWLRGECIDIALRGVPNRDQEFLVSGMMPDEWNCMFADVDDDL